MDALARSVTGRYNDRDLLILTCVGDSCMRPATGQLSRRRFMKNTLAVAGGTALTGGPILAAEQKPAPFRYVQAKAFHIPPETTTEESGYFSLCEGRNGKIYVGTAAYGRNSYLVEFDPATERMRIVLD